MIIPAGQKRVWSGRVSGRTPSESTRRSQIGPSRLRSMSELEGLAGFLLGTRLLQTLGRLSCGYPFLKGEITANF